MEVDDDSADVCLNDLYDNGIIIASYDGYALPSIIFTVRANIEIAESFVLGKSGKATIEHTPAGAYEITIGFNGVELTRDVKPTFKSLKEEINAEGSELSLGQDYIYDSAKDSSLTNGIEFAKDMTINGNGHIIDARKSSNIFYFDDDTNSYSLTLKNIVFANATGAKGAAVYFKGNKIEIINCTFISNNADSEGDAVYVEDALSTENRISESVFSENTGINSIVYVNPDSDANLKVDNSIFMKNAASKNIKANGKLTAEYNWWGNTLENNEDISRTEGVNVTNWLFLKIDAVAALTGTATLSLNNVYQAGQMSAYAEYALRPITLALGASNATVSVPEITLGDDGQVVYQFRMDKITARLTASYDDITTAKDIEYVIDDDGSFRALNEIIFFSNDGDVIELAHDYAYFDTDTITEGIVIPRKITINGNGHLIDAKGKTRIFMIPEGVSHVTINNIGFANAKASYGSVIVISRASDYFNISNCNFTNNVATNYGGVIDCVGDYCTICNCSFTSNSAVSKAGVIRYYHDALAYIKNSSFINNRVADGSSGGGVIYVDDGAVDIDRSIFIGNIANDKPGSALYTSKSATITNSIFLNNPGSYVIYGSSGVVLTDNWFGNTSQDYDSFADEHKTVSGDYHETTLNNWLYLNVKFYGNYGILSLNNAYCKADDSTGVVSNYNLPEIMLNINATTLNISTNTMTLDGSGQARFSFSKLSEDYEFDGNGYYVIYAVYKCDNDYEVSKVVNATMPVKYDLNLNVTADDIDYGEALLVKISANTSFTGDVLVEIGRLNQTVRIANGIGNATFANLSAGKYSITAAFTEDDVFRSDSANAIAKVRGIEVPADEAFAVSLPANSQSPTFTVKLDSNAAGTFTVTVDGKEVASKELAGGKASITVKDMAVGSHSISLAYSGHGIYAPIIMNTTLSIKRISTIIYPSAVSAVYGVSKKMTITLKDANYKVISGRAIRIAFNEKVYTKTTNSKGQVSLTVPNNLVVKSYVAKVTFAGDTKYIASVKDVKVAVKKASAKITAKSKAFKAGVKTKTYAIALKANEKAVKKVKVTLTVNGKTYAAVTNAKGMATFKITQLTKKGKHAAIVKFAGNKNLKATANKVIITVK